MHGFSKLRLEKGRLILEIAATIRVPVVMEVIEKAVMSGIHLTRREGEVLDGVLKGWRNKEIASELHISERTVKFHVGVLLTKFNVRGRRGDLMALFGKNRQSGMEGPKEGIEAK
jgi:DNA-binding NarL/FixJ family response regulator